MNTRFSPYENQRYDNENYPRVIQKLIKNILQLFNKTPKYEKYAVLSIVADVISKKELRKAGFTFSNTMHRTAKRKLNDDEIEDRVQFVPESKKLKGSDINEIIVDKLTQYSEQTCHLHRNQPVLNLQQSKNFIYKKMIEERPEIKLSKSQFYKLCPKNFKYSKKKTDMCDICVNGKKLKRRLGEASEDLRLEYYRQHIELNRDQKICYRQKIENLESNECIVLMDFKQKFKLGGGPVETSQVFYNQSQVSCLGFCVIYKVSGEVIRTYYNFLSEVISQDSHFVKNCLRKLEQENLRRFSNIHFWSDNAGHFRSSELKNYILRELQGKNYITSLNYFVEYHGKSDIDGHFGLLQRVFNSYERRNDMSSIYCVLHCFLEYFLEVNTDARFEIYEEPGRAELVQKLNIKDSKFYLSFFSDSNNVYGKSVSTFEGSGYRSLEHNVVLCQDKRESKYAPKPKLNEVWKVSPSQFKIMGNRVALKT